MRLVKIIILSTLLLLVSGVASAPALAAAQSDHALLAKDKQKKNEKKDNNGEDKDRGHGNDPDGVDEDNPGKSKKAVVDVGDYLVDVSCDVAEDSSVTTCTYVGEAPDGGKDIGFLQVPDGAVCADVTNSTGPWTESEPHTNLPGYTSKDESGVIELTMTGLVTTSSESTTYWIKAGSETFPASGPAIDCSVEPAGDADAETAAPTATAANETHGTVTVETSTCQDVPADTNGYDWFGVCEPEGSTIAYTLSPADPALGEARSLESDQSGVVTFGELAPGEYVLDAVGASWCHAASDNVNADGKVVVGAGTTTTVWIFMCDSAKGGA